MKKFFGFQTVKLLRAVGKDSHVDVIFGYEVEFHNVFGERSIKYMTINEINRNWDKLRMSGETMAVLEGGQVRKLNENEYDSIVLKYKGAAA